MAKLPRLEHTDSWKMTSVKKKKENIFLKVYLVKRLTIELSYVLWDRFDTKVYLVKRLTIKLSYVTFDGIDLTLMKITFEFVSPQFLWKQWLNFDPHCGWINLSLKINFSKLWLFSKPQLSQLWNQPYFFPVWTWENFGLWRHFCFITWICLRFWPKLNFI